MIINYIQLTGTGKTSVARAFGDVFHGLGLLSSNTVVECKAMELIGQYVGHSSAQVKKKMDEARGGVLFIDEAYGLDPSNSPFAKDAIEMLLANTTDPKYEGKMIIILAGYPSDIHQLIQSNPGLPRRITEQIEFKAFDANDCLDLLLEKVFNNSNNDGSKVQIPKLLHPIILDKFYELSTFNGWGNAGVILYLIKWKYVDLMIVMKMVSPEIFIHKMILIKAFSNYLINVYILIIKSHLVVHHHVVPNRK